MLLLEDFIDNIGSEEEIIKDETGRSDVFDKNLSANDFNEMCFENNCEYIVALYVRIGFADLKTLKKYIKQMQKIFNVFGINYTYPQIVGDMDRSIFIIKRLYEEPTINYKWVQKDALFTNRLHDTEKFFIIKFGTSDMRLIQLLKIVTWMPYDGTSGIMLSVERRNKRRASESQLPYKKGELIDPYRQLTNILEHIRKGVEGSLSDTQIQSLKINLESEIIESNFFAFKMQSSD